MTSCLGMYIEPNIIKYAKVSKDREILRVESFGIKFYDKLGDAIKQIISDTYSFKIPISINLSEESYQYFYMFSLLNKNDLKKAIATEFESFCTEKGMNKNALETRYALVNSLEDKEKIKVIHISANKATMNTLEQPFAEQRVSTISPIGTSISNIANLKQKENVLIINMEEETTLTTIVDQKVYQVDKIPEGARIVLDSINNKENSYSKAYEICKNSTIYTMEGKELQDEENEFLDDIMPTLYKIASQTQEKLANSTVKIDRIYLTGTLSVVNNIDLYFQEFFQTEKCEILKPFFLKENVKINIKDYIEVNSAIALALQGLDYGLKDMNFKQRTWRDDLENIFGKLNIEKKGESKTKKSKVSNLFRFDLKERLDRTEVWLLRVAGGIFFLTIIYAGFSTFLNHAITEKNQQVLTVEQDTQAQIAAVNSDITNINIKTNQYKQLSDNLKNISEQVKENNKTKKAIPILLTQIGASIPQGVQLTSIENTTGQHIVINAQSRDYEQLGYFKTILIVKGILAPDTVVSSSGVKQGEFVQIVIEGDLP
jgi:Tfp pilus assembly protein PilN